MPPSGRDGVLLLAARKIDRGERVRPAEGVPVIDVLFEGKDFDPVEGLIFRSFLSRGIGGRTTGAAFGSEEFDNNGLPGRRGGEGRGGEMHGPVGNEKEASHNGGKQSREEHEGSGAHESLPPLSIEVRSGREVPEK